MNKRLLSSSFKYREQDPSFVGQDLDPMYKDGPVEERKCTDLFCCLLILLLIGGMCFVGVLGFKTGDPSKLAAPFDQDSHQCGRDAGYTDFSKIYISFKNNNKSDIGFVCVKQCPKSQNESLQCKTTKHITNCSELYLYPCQSVVNLCYPQAASIWDQFNFNDFMNVSTLQQYFADLRDGWPLLAICVGFALLVSCLFTFFIKYCSKLFIWLIIIGFWLLMVIVGTCSFLLDKVKFIQDIVHYETLPHNLRDRDYQIACAVLCWFLAFLETVIVCCCFREIKISIGILKAAADFTREQWQTIMIPLIITILQLAFFSIWLVTVMYIFSSSETHIEPIQNTPFGFVEFNRNIQLYTLLYIVGLFWIMFFLEALGSYWVASTVAIWYFEQPQPHRPLTRSICRAMKQCGSLAFGSLIIAIVTIIRLVLEGITKALKEKTLKIDQQVGPAKCALKIAQCCIACFERLIRFLTQNAYIMMAISGKNFCESASESFYLVLRSTTQFAITHGTTKIFTFLGKMTICSICCVCGYIALTTIPYYKQNIYSPIFLTIFFALISFPVASAFLNLFDMAASTILLSYSLQLDLHKGTNNPHCPQGLRNFLRNYVSECSQSQSNIY